LGINFSRSFPGDWTKITFPRNIFPGIVAILGRYSILHIPATDTQQRELLDPDQLRTPRTTPLRQHFVCWTFWLVQLEIIDQSASSMHIAHRGVCRLISKIKWLF